MSYGVKTPLDSDEESFFSSIRSLKTLIDFTRQMTTKKMTPHFTSRLPILSGIFCLLLIGHPCYGDIVFTGNTSNNS